MEIEFNTSETARKMSHILQIGRLPYVFKISPMLFGKEFYEKYLLYNEMTSENGAPNELFERVLENNSAVASSESNSFQSAVERMDFPLIPDNDPLFERIENGIASELKKHNQKIEEHFSRVFGFPAPRRLVVILAENYAPYSSSGFGLPSRHEDACMAGYIIGSKRASDYKISLAVLIHEAVHSMLFKHKIIKEGERGSGIFTEAVIDYFVPNGMLAYKVGISKTLDIEECCKKNVAERPESSDISQQLLPAMKEYDKEFGKQTIWKFLSERGFDRYMIHS